MATFSITQTGAQLQTALDESLQAAAVIADHTIVRGHGGARATQDSLATVSDTGSIDIPTGETYQINTTQIALADLSDGGNATTAASTITDNAVVRGDGGTRGLQAAGPTIDDEGVLQLSSGIAYKTQTLTDQATVAWDCDSGNFATVTLTDNRTLGAATNQTAGGPYFLIVKQDAGGTNTLAWNANYLFPGGSDPILSAGGNEIDIFMFISDGTNMFGVSNYNFS